MRRVGKHLLGIAIAPWADFLARLPSLQLQPIRAVGQIALVAARSYKFIPAMTARLRRHAQVCDAHVAHVLYLLGFQ